ncbi:MAG: N-formylglutamate deformylase [Alphaproteobacteria bacterium]
MTEAFTFKAGAGPLLVSMPHVGTALPEAIAARMTALGKTVPDTDWHVDRLYDFLGDLDASVLAATQSRYVIDLNRAPDDKPLYPGASNTGLCPATTFDEEPIYLDGQKPDAAEIAARKDRVYRPYHERLGRALAAIRKRHGYALLWDAHSIRSRVPRFFEGRLPDLNLGSAGGVSADPALISCLRQAVEIGAETVGYSHALDGRFKGGYITRSFGDPAKGIHAMQLELSQITYMDEAPPFGFRDDLAAGIRPVLRRLLETMLDWGQGAMREGD